MQKEDIANMINKRFPFLTVNVSEIEGSFGRRVLMSYQFFVEGRERVAQMAQIIPENITKNEEYVWMTRFIRDIPEKMSLHVGIIS